MAQVYVILPAFNEARVLGVLVPEIAASLASAALSFRILVVNDGSNDPTVSVVKSLPSSSQAELLNHSVNRGYGAALWTGFEKFLSLAQDDDLAVTLDADATHPPRYIPDLVTKSQQGFDVVTASYAMPGGKAYGVPLLRQFMSRGVNFLFQCAFPMPGLTTYSNGFRAYRASALRKAQAHFGPRLITESGFPGGAELFLKVCRAGSRAGEIPFDLHYERRGADSKIHFAQTISRYLHLLKQARRIRQSTPLT